MIHGHTRIILRNPISGNILKDIESENVFQNTVIANGLRNLGNANASPYNYNASSRDVEWKTAVGGLLLLQNTEQSGTQYMSPTNKMIGNGCVDFTNGGLPNEMGSFNASESSASQSAIVQVYEFGTSQANGTIGSVCLTSKIGGFMGCGNPSGKIFEDLTKFKPINQYLSPKVLNMLNNVDASSNVDKHIIVGNTYYYLKSFTSSTLTITKGRVPCKIASIFDEIYSDVAINISGLPSISNPTFRTDGTKLYVFDLNQKTITAGGNYSFWEIDVANSTATARTFTNPLSSSIIVATGGASIADGCLFLSTNTGKLVHCFNLSNNTLKATFNFSSLSTGANDRFTCRNYQPGKVLCLCSVGSTGSLVVFLDTNNGTILPTNTYLTDAPNIGYDPTNDVLTYSLRYGVYAFNNPIYLATINNLGSPVEKTSAKTMKVIYELSEA